MAAHDYLKSFRALNNVYFSTILILGVVGNMMVIFVIFKTKEMRNSTNILLANLAVADIFTLLVWGARTLNDINSEHDVYDQSEFICYTLPLVKDALIFASVLTILAIGFERYYAVCQPLKASYICNKKRAYRICLFVWATAVLSSSPKLLIKIYQPEQYINGKIRRSHCDSSANLPLKKAYYITSTLIFFVLPLLILTVLFKQIARHLKRAVTSSVNIAAMRHRRQVVKMLAIVVICFFVCHLPYRIRTLLKLIWHDELLTLLGRNGYKNLSLFCKAVLFLHSALNPILYNMMSNRFRAGFKNILSHMVSACYWSRRSRNSARESTNTTVTPTNASSSV